jgi:four helix bundle protein
MKGGEIMISHRTSNIERRTPKIEQRVSPGISQRTAPSSFELEERLLSYAASILHHVERLPNTRAGYHIAGQLLHLGTSPLSNPGEAEAAEAHEDFVDKLKICLKELRESLRWIRLIRRCRLLPEASVAPLEKETDELVRIFLPASEPPVCAPPPTRPVARHAKFDVQCSMFA